MELMTISILKKDILEYILDSINNDGLIISDTARDFFIKLILSQGTIIHDPILFDEQESEEWRLLSMYLDEYYPLQVNLYKRSEPQIELTFHTGDKEFTIAIRKRV